MRGELVALDLETTGLDPFQDEIIEVGAVRLKDGEVIDEFSTMVDPGRPIPSHITHLTGIHQDDVNGAPKIDKVLPQIMEFVGDSPVIAHNINLDMGFLQDRHRILLNNARIDTYDLSSVLMPRAPRYNLNSLTKQAGIDLENAHRALDDARATALLYWELWQLALNLPHSTLEEIVKASGTHDWSAIQVFREALRESTTTSTDKARPLYKFADPSTDASVSFSESGSLQTLDPDKIKSVLSDDGELSHALPNFHARSQQIEMAQAITTAFNKHEHLMVEAGTGTGKSIAYLVPAILWAVKNNRRVIISTNTINLQDQLINKDIPALQDALEVDFKAVVLKGRSNYLSPQRLEIMRRRKPATIVELRTYAKILVWLLENETGDRSDINLRGPGENNVWDQLSAQSDDTDVILYDAPFQRARKAAESAHLVIINHALLVSDAVAENHVLPDYHYLIVDEAHHLEDAISYGLRTQLDQSLLLRRLANLGGPKRGLLGDILNTIQEHGSTKDIQRFESFIEHIGQATSLMEVHVKTLFAKMLSFIDDVRNNRATEFMTILRVTEQHRTKANFAAIHHAWKAVNEFFDVISGAMLQLNAGLNRLDENTIFGITDLATNAASAARQLDELKSQLYEFIIEPDVNGIYSMRIGQGDEAPSIQSAPLHIGPMMEKFIWHKKDSVILTSATLRASNSFTFIKDRLYADQIRTLEVGSPFNYRESTLLYIPNDVPEPTDRQGYQRALEKAIIELAAALDGRVMALFTSYSQLRQTSQAVTPRLSLGNISVYDQSDGTSREALIDGFKSTDKAVLLGTRSFWEGVDIPGESLSALIITRLPFSVPTDPVFAARSETYDNAFSQYTLPDAILRFRQGFGRLIRSASDRGVVVVMDRRIISKRYGTDFLEALPDCEMRDGSLDSLSEIAKNWLNR